MQLAKGLPRGDIKGEDASRFCASKAHKSQMLEEGARGGDDRWAPTQQAASGGWETGHEVDLCGIRAHMEFCGFLIADLYIVAMRNWNSSSRNGKVKFSVSLGNFC